MTKFKYRVSRPPKKHKRPFRLLDLPAELQILIFEQMAVDTTILFPFPYGNPQAALLQTSKMIKQQVLPIMCTLATFEVTVIRWDFQPVFDVTQAISRLRTDLAISSNHRNPSLSIYIKPDEWIFNNLGLQKWLMDFPQILTFDWVYSAHQSVEDRLWWRSSTEFRWNTGCPYVNEFRQTQEDDKKTKDDDDDEYCEARNRELDGIIGAFMEESYQVHEARKWWEENELE